MQIVVTIIFWNANRGRNLQSFVETETTHYVFVEDIDDLDTLPEPDQTPD